MQTDENEPKRYLVTGVLDSDSISWHVARSLVDSGAQVYVTCFGRASRRARRALADLNIADIFEMDATDPEALQAVVTKLRAGGDKLDGALHSIAAAAPNTLGGAFLTSDPIDVEASYRVSVISFTQLVEALLPLLSNSPSGGSVVGLTVESTRALRGYDWMGVHKAALQSAAKYAALYAGSKGVRVNLVASGPLKTFSSAGVPTFDAILHAHQKWSPLGWNSNYHSAVSDAVKFFLSPESQSITGEVLHVDGGFHMNTPV